MYTNWHTECGWFVLVLFVVFGVKPFFKAEVEVHHRNDDEISGI